jgi:uncharacterized membrane protein
VTTQSRTIAILAYLLPIVGPFGALALRRDDPPVRYHASQALAIDLGALAAPLLWAVIAWVLTWVPTAGALLGVLSFGLVLAFEALLLVARLLGVARVVRGELRPAPVVGGWAERFVYAREHLPPPTAPEQDVVAAAEQPPTPDVLADAQPEIRPQVHTDTHR